MNVPLIVLLLTLFPPVNALHQTKPVIESVIVPPNKQCSDVGATVKTGLEAEFHVKITWACLSEKPGETPVLIASSN